MVLIASVRKHQCNRQQQYRIISSHNNDFKEWEPSSKVSYLICFQEPMIFCPQYWAFLLWLALYSNHLVAMVS